MLNGKTVVVGVTGGIAAFKAAQLVSDLVKEGCNVNVVMTKNAMNFINPITFETLTGNKCLTDTFDRNFEFNVEHVALSQRADAFIIAPATANIIGKLANGIADDMLSTMVLAAKCDIIIAPAMNTYMYENSIVQENMDKLKKHGFIIIEPDSGRLACGDSGKGKLPGSNTLIAYLRKQIEFRKDMNGIKLTVTAGPTAEAIDPVRFITNHSTGKMGYAIAQAAAYRGAEVTLISGPVNIEPPYFTEFITVRSAEDMFNAVYNQKDKYDILVMSAAVADYTPDSYSEHKIKKNDGDMYLSLKRTDDILGFAGKHKKENQLICGFSMETRDLIENSRKKLISKNCDIIAANSLNEKGSGFGTNTNKITLITPNSCEELELLSKSEAAHKLLDKLLKMRKAKDIKVK